MGQLFAKIRELVAKEKYVVGQNAAEQLQAHQIKEWQAVAAVESGEFLVERPEVQPHPVVEVAVQVVDFTRFTAVWSVLPDSGVAKLVNIHSIDRSFTCGTLEHMFPELG